MSAQDSMPHYYNIDAMPAYILETLDHRDGATNHERVEPSGHIYFDPHVWMICKPMHACTSE